MPTPDDGPASLIGSEVSHVTFDNQTALNLFHQEDGGAIWDADLTIFTPFVLRSADGTTHNLDPETSRAALAPVIDLLDTTITGVTVDGDDTLEYDSDGNPTNALGTLILDFADGAQLTVPPHPKYEPWLLDYRDLDDDDEPEARGWPRLSWPRLRRLILRPLRLRQLRGGGFKPRSRAQGGRCEPTTGNRQPKRTAELRHP